MLIQAAGVHNHSLIIFLVSNLHKEREICPAGILELTFCGALGPKVGSVPAARVTLMFAEQH